MRYTPDDTNVSTTDTVRSCTVCGHYSICMIREDFKKVINEYEMSILDEFISTQMFELLGRKCNKFIVSS